MSKPNTNPAAWIRQELLDLHAYHVPDATGMIKLDAMENPYTLPAALQSEWQAGISTASLNRYPDPAASELHELLSDYFEVPAGQRLILGNGSDELIQLLALALAVKPDGSKGALLTVEPGFAMYKLIAEFVGMDYVGVPLRADDFQLDLPTLLAAIEASQPALVFLAYPNNPTGNLFDRAALEQVLATAPGIVVIDEAYHAFAEQSFMWVLADYDNLIVMRTLSKLGLAGLRLGAMAGSPAWLDQFDKLRLPYNINALTQYSAAFGLRHVAELEKQAATLRAERTLLIKGLEGLSQVNKVWPSSANFVLFRTLPGQGVATFEGLKQAGVLIKNLNAAHASLKDCLRVTVGTPDENQAFLTALAQC